MRELARRCTLAGLDVVEVCPADEGSQDRTALVASRVVREALGGIAIRRAARGGRRRPRLSVHPRRPASQRAPAVARRPPRARGSVSGARQPAPGRGDEVPARTRA